ncbi:hypothetical protein [Psychrobacter sp. AT9]|uniref:hypothetical protein n=1 Tax=Psychrobacter sp. AT9 TaxID=3242893 RepID=UPI0039A69C31
MSLISTMQGVTIVGAKPSDFKIEDYVENTTKLYVLVALDDSTGGKGQSVQEFNYKTAEDMKDFDSLDFPVDADIKVELVTSGKRTKLIVKDVKTLAKPQQTTNKV